MSNSLFKVYFEYPPQWRTYCAIWLLHGQPHRKLLLSWCLLSTPYNHAPCTTKLQKIIKIAALYKPSNWAHLHIQFLIHFQAIYIYSLGIPFNYNSQSTDIRNITHTSPNLPCSCTVTVTAHTVHATEPLIYKVIAYLSTHTVYQYKIVF